MTQLVELQEALPKFQAAGIKLYAVSYDEPGALADFAQHHGIRYPLLSDRGSRVIHRFGIQNYFVTREQVPFHGIPFPGTYLVDERGIVSAKFFQRNLAQRESAEAVIDSALGEILLGEEEPSARGGASDIRVTASYHGGGGKLKAGVIRQIVVRFELAPGLHIYAEPVPEGMVATRIQVSGPPGLCTGAWSRPPTQALRLPGVATELQVWEGRVDFVAPVWADDRIAGITAKLENDAIPIEVQIDYQACDDKACRIPQSETLQLRVPVAPYVGHHLAGKLPGAVATTMNTRKWMLRKLGRALWRSPIQGLRFLKHTQEQVRQGPLGRRRGR